MCECVYDVCNVSLIFLKRQTKKAEKSFSFFFLLFSLLQEVFVSFPQTERVKINHRKKNRDSKKKKKKKKKILRK